MNALDNALLNANFKAYAAYGTSSDANIRYLTSFRTSDPVIYLKRYGEEGIIIVPAMEVERAAIESPCTVMSRADAGFFDILREEPDPLKATGRMIADLSGGPILVSPEFPFGLAQAIAPHQPIQVDMDTLSAMRSKKTASEIGMMRESQAAAEDALETALTMIKRAKPTGELLVTPEGRILTSEDVRYAIHATLQKHGCRGIDTIVASGKETSMVHLRGRGSLAANAPIIIDIFPQHEETGYFADMTRTVVRGEASPEILEMYAAVSDAKTLAFSLLRAGADGSALYQAVVSFFEDAGYGTEPHGFVHSLGHGVGIEVHEAPSLSTRGGPLAAGNVVTIEPGLYYPGIGGVRIEDMALVTDGGYDRITRFREVFCI
ncbi:aminopeptidase P family protein [Methanocalculus taiwanensis]|uniref:Aminopeptidase P family protein n=1 Tax=Methanocalculus taiwanensis TaxID=106207 RepID=A0ABD4TLB5_9EURY|nr:Xaa-Pro peptidase family protein [Methanocalculus taiwanensis]MCQ1538342.1 aminopeptidase P family protein [Methanocalculus taiwanensis]